MTQSDAVAVAKFPESRRANIFRAVFAATVGTVIEWYDYALYGAASGLIISKLFFPSLEPLNATLAAFATFAVGYFIRPLGGVVLSHIGDRFGRKPALILTICLMGGATCAMGFLPTFAQVGVLAPLLLVVLRLVQGFGAGAELAGAMTLLAEYTPPNRRAFYTSIPSAATVVGIMLATISFLAISYLPEQEMLGWGWRLPFILSAVLFLVALYIRNRLDETPEYVAAMEQARARHREQKVPLSDLLKNSPREVLFGFVSLCGHNANAYILSTFSLSYMTKTLGMSPTAGLTAVIIAALCGSCGTPVLGAVADRIGADKVYIFGGLFIALMAFPLFMMLDTRQVGWAAFAMSLCYFFGYGATAGAQGAFLTRLFPTRYRFSGVAVSRELNGMLVAGPTPLIAAALVGMAGGKPTLVACYVILCGLLTVIGVFGIRKQSIHD
jgi:MFS family permease